jgi:primosomal protein N' (replication factor Y)
MGSLPQAVPFRAAGSPVSSRPETACTKMEEKGEFAEVTVTLPVEKTFSYLVPPSLRARVRPGSLVCVPFRTRVAAGVVLRIHTGPPPGQELKEIIQALGEDPVFDSTELAFYGWAARYYLHSMGRVLRGALPADLQDRAGPPAGRTSSPRALSATLTEQGRQCLGGEAARTRRLGRRQAEILRLLETMGCLSVTEIGRCIPGTPRALSALERKGLVSVRRGERLAAGEGPAETAGEPPPTLTPLQAGAMGPIEKALLRREFEAFLLWGVTGSGKTELYLRAADLCLKEGRQVLVLVPEISLTHQLVQEFRSRFGCAIAVLHSRLSRRERGQIWHAIHRSQVSIVLGARSALFAPCHRLGLIIVDEEHDGSYKQEEGFRYQARDLALMRGKASSGVVLLGSATPSLETLHNAQTGKIGWLTLPERVEGRPLPQVEVVDLRRQKTGGGREILSLRLQEAMEETMARGEQTVLFLNRRGYATFLLCPDCGHVFSCPNCAVSLVHHLSHRALQCHYCGWHQPSPALCPRCGGTEVKDLGVGTESLEQAVKARFPRARVLRMDRDTTSGKGTFGEILRAWKKGEADVLIGTQMVAKGHHVPNVTLVGVALADTSLNLPDFRAAERTFQLLVQVSGRAGRGERPGRVIIQTYCPQHPSIVYAVTQDYMGFARRELEARKAAGYPPFRHLILFRLSGPREEEIASFGRLLGEAGRRLCAGTRGVACLGPSPAPLARVKGRYRWHLLLKGESRSELHEVARALMGWARQRLSSKRVRLTVDVDPQSFL